MSTDTEAPPFSCWGYGDRRRRFGVGRVDGTESIPPLGSLYLSSGRGKPKIEAALAFLAKLLNPSLNLYELPLTHRPEYVLDIMERSGVARLAIERVLEAKTDTAC